MTAAIPPVVILLHQPHAAFDTLLRFGIVLDCVTEWKSSDSSRHLDQQREGVLLLPIGKSQPHFVGITSSP